MKKILTGILTAAVLVSITATTALAAGQGQARRFTDNNGDGVCDYRSVYCRYLDETEDDLQNYGQNRCQYTDEDGNGICDFRENREEGGNAFYRWGQGLRFCGGRNR